MIWLLRQSGMFYTNTKRGLINMEHICTLAYVFNASIIIQVIDADKWLMLVVFSPS